MHYTRVQIAALGYELAPVVVTSREIEARLAPLYQKLHIQPGQLEALTGIRERRWWHPGTPLSQGATAAGRKALAAAGIDATELGALLYTGVCREGYEPATACAVAASLGVTETCAVYDISNACLGVLNGMVDIANRIELGEISCGLVVSCESAREIIELTMAQMLEHADMAFLSTALATLTGGSGAVAVLLTATDSPLQGHRLRTVTHRTAPEHCDLCRWGQKKIGSGPEMVDYMRTDAASVLKNGVELGRRTWEAFLLDTGLNREAINQVICHQVGEANRNLILKTLQIDPRRDFSTFSFLGNIGTVSLPITAAIARDRNVLRPGDQVAFLGIGSGLNCMMMHIDW